MFAFFTLLLGLVAITGWLILLQDWRASATWEKVPATVKAVKVNEGKGSIPEKLQFQKQGYHVTMSYIYDIDGQRYVGKRFGALRQPFFLTQEEVNTFKHRFPLGGSFPVRVNLAQPTQALVERRLTWFDLMPGGIGIAMVLLGMVSLS
jgi:hypothetical protein